MTDRTSRLTPPQRFAMDTIRRSGTLVYSLQTRKWWGTWIGKDGRTRTTSFECKTIATLIKRGQLVRREDGVVEASHA